MDQLEYIQKSVSSQPRQSILFNDAVIVKSSPHVIVFACWGACVGPGGVYLMDGESNWHGPLKKDQANADLVISSIYQRMKALQLPAPSAVVAQYDNDINATIFD